MAGRIRQDILERIKETADIVALISTYVALKRSGRGFMGLCPFHISNQEV